MFILRINKVNFSLCLTKNYAIRMVNVTPIYPRGKRHNYSLNRNLGRAPNQVWITWRGKNPAPTGTRTSTLLPSS